MVAVIKADLDKTFIEACECVGFIEKLYVIINLTERMSLFDSFRYHTHVTFDENTLCSTTGVPLMTNLDCSGIEISHYVFVKEKNDKTFKSKLFHTELVTNSNNWEHARFRRAHRGAIITDTTYQNNILRATRKHLESEKPNKHRIMVSGGMADKR